MIQFETFSEFNRHKTVCGKWRNAKGVGKKSSKRKTLPQPPSLISDDSNANLDPTSVARASTSTTWIVADSIVVKSEQSSVLSTSDLIQNSNSNVKLETFDSSSQPALAAAGASHWKCNQVNTSPGFGPLKQKHKPCYWLQHGLLFFYSLSLWA